MFSAAPWTLLFSPCHKFSWQRSRTTSLSPAIPLPHQPRRPYLFLLPPPAYSASPVQRPSVILASAALLLKSVFSPLMLTSPPKHLPCFIPFACHQPPPVPDFSQTFLALMGLTMEWNSCGMGRAKAPNSFSLFFLPRFLRGKAANTISRTECGWNCIHSPHPELGGTIRSSPESGGKRVQAKANCPSPIGLIIFHFGYKGLANLSWLCITIKAEMLRCTHCEKS